MFTKTLIAVLILATTSGALTSKVNAGPNKYLTPAELSWMDHASQVSDAGAQ